LATKWDTSTTALVRGATANVCLTIDTVQLGEIEGLHHRHVSLQHVVVELARYTPARR